MTTKAKTTPPHGTYARASGSRGYRAPCKCEPCRIERRRAEKRMRVNRELGRSPFVNPAQAQAHLALLHKEMSWPHLATASSVPEANLIRIYAGRRPKIRHETHAKIMAVRLPPKGDGGQYIDATGSIRRARAMACVGHSVRTIAQAANTPRNRIISIQLGRQQTITRALAERITAAYQQLAHQPAPFNKHTARTRNAAAARGWHGPLAWDCTIDDPTAEPDVEQPQTAAASASKRSEVEHLAHFGIAEDQICLRTGASTAYVRQIVTELHSGQRRVRKGKGEAA